MSLRHLILGPNKRERDRSDRIVANLARDGLRASDPDDRDIVFVERVDPTNIRRVMFPHYSKREDQGKVGRCTAETMTAVCEGVHNFGIGGEANYSPDFNYHYSRFYDGLSGDSGATPRGCCKAAKKNGMIPEAQWPRSNDPAQWDRAPTEEEIALGATQCMGQYELIEIDRDNYKNTVRRIQAAMAEGMLVALAFMVRRWHFYVSGPLGSSGHKRPFPTPATYDEWVGNHMVPMVGFDRDIFPSSGGAFVIRNSWGADWGDNGEWSIPFTMFTGTDFVLELRAVRGFAGIELAPAPEVPLTLEQIKQDAEDLAALGLGTAGDSFTFNPASEVPYLAAWTLLQKKGRTYAQAAQVVGVPADAIKSFVESQPDRVVAWSRL